ncbi:hypothetical protein NMY22_g9637 [Coprinellus aureogranulatus]|nr:hypothetical protein NMY22_g9637 [Coprinellus aureogranulatus]
MFNFRSCAETNPAICLSSSQSECPVNRLGANNGLVPLAQLISGGRQAMCHTADPQFGSHNRFDQKRGVSPNSSFLPSRFHPSTVTFGFGLGSVTDYGRFGRERTREELGEVMRPDWRGDTSAYRWRDAPTAPPRQWVNTDDEPFMLYRDPPPWSALEEAKSAQRAQEIERRELVKRNVQSRASDVANVDYSSRKATAMRQQMDSLLVKRTEMRETFGLLDPAKPLSKRPLTTFTPMPTENPFAKRATSARDKLGCHAQQGPTKDERREWVPISKVPTPVFTQDLLDASAKENRNSVVSPVAGQAAKKQRRVSLPSTAPGSKAKSKPPRRSDQGTSGSDLRKWLITK